MKMTKELISKIMILRKQGVTYKEISRRLGVLESSIHYYTNEEYRNKRKEASRNKSKSLTIKEKKERYQKNYPRVKKWFYDKYHTDPEFRAKHIMRVIESERRRKEKVLL